MAKNAKVLSFRFFCKGWSPIELVDQIVSEPSICLLCSWGYDHSCVSYTANAPPLLMLRIQPHHRRGYSNQHTKTYTATNRLSSYVPTCHVPKRRQHLTKCRANLLVEGANGGVSTLTRKIKRKIVTFFRKNHRNFCVALTTHRRHF